MKTIASFNSSVDASLLIDALESQGINALVTGLDGQGTAGGVFGPTGQFDVAVLRDEDESAAMEVLADFKVAFGDQHADDVSIQQPTSRKKKRKKAPTRQRRRLDPFSRPRWALLASLPGLVMLALGVQLPGIVIAVVGGLLGFLLSQTSKPFMCSDCGARLTGADWTCPSCGRDLVAPKSDNAVEEGPARSGLQSALFVIVVLLAGMLVLAGLFAGDDQNPKTRRVYPVKRIPW